MSMGINNERTHQIIANMTGKSVEEVRAWRSLARSGAMDKQENQRFATPRLSKAVKDVTGRDVSGPGMLKAARGLGDIDAAAAQSAFGNDQLVGPTRAQIEGFVGPTQGGRASTTTDTIKEEEAKRAGSLDILTQVIENGALKVRIVEGAQVQRESDKTNQRTFDADKAVVGPRGSRGSRGYNNFGEK
ncbi:MAG: hypothetical protein HC902_14715 [Calothrix sp. SM1_5_4]|nr:hypothetical protein [Calothrix sp. SM1_5_4]